MHPKRISIGVFLVVLLAAGCTNNESPVDPNDPCSCEGEETQPKQPLPKISGGYSSNPQSMSDFKWPFRGLANACGPESWKIVCGYGCGYHVNGTYQNYHAVDLARVDGPTTGSMVLAPAYGTIKSAKWSTSCGWMVVMDHGNGWTSELCHLQCDPRYFVSPDNVLLQGTVIGNAGATGWTGPERGRPAYPHIHFVIKRNGVSQPLTGISGFASIVSGGVYYSTNPFVLPPSGRTTCP